MLTIIKIVLGFMTGIFSFYLLKDVIKNRKLFSGKSWSGLLGTGFISNFFDTLGISSFAQQTAIFKTFRLVDDRLIPGTLNVGNTIPTVAQAFIFMTIVEVDLLTLVTMAMAAPVGGVLGAGIVAKMSRNKIQITMSVGLIIVALVVLAGLLNFMPLGGEAIGLRGWKLAFVIVMSFVFGAIQTIGIGIYGPFLALVYALGMHPATAFPIMMTSAAMPLVTGGARFIKEAAYDRKSAISMTIAGIVGVFLAAFVVKSLPLNILKWTICGVLFYTSIMMFISSKKKDPENIS